METGSPTATATPRRASFFDTWRLLIRGGAKGWWLALFVCAGMMMPRLMTPHRHIGLWKAFLFDTVLLVFSFSFGTWQYEGEVGERLAFLSVIAQPVDLRRLLLVPMGALALVVTAILVGVDRLPPAVALALLGVAWSTIGTTRWLWRLGGWSWLALPIFAVEPAAVYAAQRFAGWGAAAALSIAWAIAVLAFQPRVYVGEPLSRLMKSDRLRTGPPARAARRAVSASAGVGGSWLASAARFSRINLTGAGWSYTAAIVFIVVATILVGSIPFIGQGSIAIFWLPVLAAAVASRAYSGDMREFLAARPFKARERVGGLVLPLLIPLLAAAAALCAVNPHWVDIGGPFGIWKPHPPRAAHIRYMREVLGATFLPDQWPAGGLPHHLWVQLRPLLYVDVLRLTLLMVAVFFAVPIPKAGENPRRRVAAGNIVLILGIFGVLLRTDLLDTFRGWPMPGVPFLALLAAASIAHWVWRARAINAPPRPAAARP
jgi:hypothetical protein